MFKLLIAVSLFCLVSGFPQKSLSKAGTCGYDACNKPKPGFLNVHIVPHSHDDVGWLKTVEQYYYGNKNELQTASVQYILDSVVEALYENSERKFIYVETAFFWKWWQDQSDSIREKVKILVANGQLEFIGGAWSMNDEANVHYQSVIDQFTWGLRKLNDTFGYCGHPKLGWQVDPFGHSRENAAIMALLGFDGLLFGRLDYQDKNNRLKTKTMEMVWEANPTLGDKADLFTGALFNTYSTPPGGFCWDVLCGDDPVIDEPGSPSYNADKIVDTFIKYVTDQHQYYRTDNIILTFGDDFQYSHAHRNFKNIDKLISHVNSRQENGSDVNVFYSTPSCYVKSLNEANLTWSTKQDDFFPFSTNPTNVFAGYYTSRPSLKAFERKGNNILQVCKQLSSLINAGSNLPDLDVLREAMGVLQHHDAITGTERQHVADDYARLLANGIDRCRGIIENAVGKLLFNNGEVQSLPLQSCPFLNISECAVSADSENFVVTIYNPLSRENYHYVRLPVSGSGYKVIDSKGSEVVNQIVEIPQLLIDVPGRTSTTTSELVFKAENLPPLGYRSYYISKSQEIETKTRENVKRGKLAIGNEKMRLEFDEISGLLSSISTNGKEILLKHNIEYYLAEDDEHGFSGSYILLPLGNETHAFPFTVNITLISGEVVDEVHQVFSGYASQVYRNYKDEGYTEVEWLVGPIPIDDGVGKEVVSKYQTDINNNGTFYTDSNGRQVLERRKNYRPSWPLEVTQPVAGNYYPITTDISINDGVTEFAVITDRAQGGSSLHDGEIELMLHRRLQHIDFGDPLNETAYGEGLVTRGRHWLLTGNVGDGDYGRQKRLLQQQKVLDSYILLADAGSLDSDSWLKNYRLEFSGLTKALPDSVQILTLETWRDNEILLRVENILEESESGTVTTVSLDSLFSTFNVVDIRETTLGGNEWLDESKRLKWEKETTSGSRSPNMLEPSKALPEITLNPKEIRTFVISIAPGQSA